ncbi:MAG: citrate synthase [Chloroflexi bacterium]|nr:citrate synthase [Chloroflexota bacterium]
MQYSPGLEGVIAADTQVSYLDVEHEEIVIRGYDLIELAQHLEYTDVAYLVIHGSLPTKEESKKFSTTLRNEAPLPEATYRLLELLPKSTEVMDALRTGISFLGGYEDAQVLNDTSISSNLAKGLRILAKAPGIASNAYRILHNQVPVHPDPKLDFTENFLRMILGETPDAEAREIFGYILTCYVEHELANSTFALRVIASTLADIYGSVVGAVASLKGPLHGGANEAYVRMLLEINAQGGPARAESYVMEKLQAKARIMGFGHRVYMRKYDPRAYLLRNYIPRLASRRPEGKDLHTIYQTVEQVMLREKGLYPNADSPIGLLFYLLGIPIPLFTPIFLCARIPGLVAHAVEQQADNRLYRPRVTYQGPRGLHLPS